MYSAIQGPKTGVNAAGVTSLPELTAMYRRKRLIKDKNNWILGITLDLVWGALPWILFSAIVATTVTAIRTEVQGADDIFALFNAPVAIGAISTFASFLLVTKQGANLANNATIIGGFGDLSGAVVNIALYVKSQISSGKTIEFITLADGSGGYYQTTRIGLALSSVCYIVKYQGRGVPIIPIQLPLGQDAALLESFSKLLAPANGGKGIDEFSAIILTIGELVDQFQQGQKASEYAVLFSQITAVTGAQGKISGTAGYGGPYLMKYLLYILYGLYLFLLIATDLSPNNKWNSIWIVSILAFCTVSFYQISERYNNPMKLRTKTAGQAPFVPDTCRGCENAVVSVFSRSKSLLINGATSGGSIGALTTNAVPPMQFNLAGSRV